MHRRTTRSIAAAIVLALGVAACDTPDPGPLELGYVLPESGQLAFLGPPMIAAVELAVDDMNAAGGVLGHAVSLAGTDEAGDAVLATQGAAGLIEDGVDAIIGAAATTMTLAIVETVTDAGVLQCSGASSAPQLRDADHGGLYLRTVPNDGLQGAFAAALMLADGNTSPAIVARHDDYGQGLAQTTADALEAAGATVADHILYDPGTLDVASVVDDVLDAGADAVYLIGFDEGAEILRGLIDAGHGPSDFPVYSSDGMRANTLSAMVDPDHPGVLEGLQGTAPDAEEADGALVGRLPATDDVGGRLYAAETYDCAIVLGLAAEIAGSTDPARMAEVLTDVTADGAPCRSFAECARLIADGEDIAYRAASGIVLERTGTGNHEPASARYEHWRIDANGFVETVRTAPASF